MSFNEYLPLLVLASSFIPGLIIFFLAESQIRTRTALNLFGSVLKLLLIGYMLWGVQYDENYTFHYIILPGMELVLKSDFLAMLFLTLSAVLWFLTTLYAIGYLEGSPHRSRFFGFFSLCVTATAGVAMAGNLLTFFIFYEILTLSAYPLVLHRGTKDAIHAGKIYLTYTLTGGAVFLVGIVWLYSLLGDVKFVSGGVAATLGSEHEFQLQIIFLLLIAGLGVKAALVPVHGWLPKAMVAPAPVSALLHAVAVVKAGAFGIVRVVYEVYGIEFAQRLDLLLPLAVVAAITIIWGSLRALWQDDLKRRLAYSTVSQVSYIMLGVAVFGMISTIGGIVHLVHQGIMKITLFFCAGNYAETLGIHQIKEMNGSGRRMPWTSIAFSVAAFGMIGAPLTAGYVTKQYLSQGAQIADMPWVGWVLTASSLLNAAYFLPILYRIWFRNKENVWPCESIQIRGWWETNRLLLIPPIITAIMTLLAGVLSDIDWSPLFWAKMAAELEYLP